jgi:hypothetical protein
MFEHFYSQGLRTQANGPVTPSSQVLGLGLFLSRAMGLGPLAMVTLKGADALTVIGPLGSGYLAVRLEG